MSILNIVTETPGLSGVIPRIVRIQTNDTLEEITAEDYLEPAKFQGYTFYPTDVFVISDNNNVSRFFIATITSSSITLTQIAGQITTPVTDGDFAIFDGASGDLQDAGYSPSDSSKSKVVMANGATVANNFAAFADVNGTVKDTGARIIAGTTPPFGGGSTNNAFVVAGLTSASKGSAVIRTSTNAVSITSAVPSTNTLLVSFSANPGPATTVDYIYSTATLT